MKFITSFSKSLKSSLRPDPERDWLVLFIGSMLVLASIIVWNIWAFDTVTRGGVIGATATSTTPLFDQASLDTVHRIFADRATEELKYVSGVYHFVDPSQ